MLIKRCQMALAARRMAKGRSPMFTFDKLQSSRGSINERHGYRVGTLFNDLRHLRQTLKTLPALDPQFC